VSCRDLVAIASDYIDEELPHDLVARVDLHLADCPYCREYLAQMRTTVRWLASYDEPPSPELSARLMDTFREWAAG
jgi:anti-sigma factor RsiW